MAAPPAITSISPTGAQRGAQVTLEIEGTGLDSIQELVSTLTSRVELLAGVDGSIPTPTRAAVKFTLSRAEAPGTRVFRVRTREGISNPVLFSVDVFPESQELEPNDSGSAANLITPPATVTGRLSPADRDAFRFRVKSGERLVFEADARRIGSSVDPTLHLYSGSGREIALAEDTEGLDVDARIDHTFAADDECWLEIHDAIYAARVPNFYRLRIGDFAHASSVFPQGGRAGSEVNFAFHGDRIKAAASCRVQLPMGPIGALVTLRLPPELDAGGPSPFRLRVGDLPEILELHDVSPERLFPPVTVNGRIDVPAEVDRYVLDCAPGQAWTITVDAARLGSSLDAVITASREDGSIIATADDDGLDMDPRLELAIPEGAHRVLVEVRDVHGRGGVAFPYRLTAQPRSPDFSLRLVSMPAALPISGTAVLEVECVRHGYNGTVRLLTLPRLEGLELRGGDIAPGQTRGFLSMTSPDKLALRALRFSVLGVGNLAESTLERQASGTVYLASEQGTPASPLLVDEIVTAIADPAPLSLRPESDSVQVPAGGICPLRMMLTRREGVAATLEVVLDALLLPGGVTTGEARIAVGESAGTLELKAAAVAPQGEGYAVFRARITPSGGAALVVPAPLVRVRVVSPPLAGAPAPADSVKGKASPPTTPP